jgi:Zn-dependent protease with chaperone function
VTKLPDMVRTAAADERPMPSHFRLALLVLEGYAYLGVVLGVFVAAVAFLVWGVLNRRPFIALLAILIGVPLIITTGRAVGALWFGSLEPHGIVVTRTLGGALHATVENIRKRIGAPHVHLILVTAAFNASALQVSRAGIFWPRNTLLLGYPLLATLSPEHTRAVIAHELGHMTHAHGRIMSWVHRTRLSWMLLMRNLREREATPAHALLLFRWYVPRLQRLATAVSRQQELLADHLAAWVTSSETTAQALVAIDIGGWLFDRTFWPGIFDRVQHDPAPPCPFAQMGPAIWTTVAIGERAALLNNLLERETGLADTHPSLRERLARLDQAAELPGIVSVTAADRFLGEQKQQIVDEFDRQWQAEQAREWRQRHEALRHDRERLAQLTAIEAPTLDDRFELAQLTERDGREDAGLALYRAAHAAGHAGAGLAAGRILLHRDSEMGMALIQAAMDAEPALVQEGCSVLIDFLERHSRHADAHQFKVRQARDATRSNMAATERLQVTPVDRFVPCADSAVNASPVVSWLATEREVLRAFLVTKELRYSNGTQTVLALLARGLSGSDLRERLRREGLIPNGVTIAVLTRHDQQLQAALEEIPGALIYERVSS